MNGSLADEARAEHLRVLGPELGSLYHALLNEVIWLHAKWLEYRKLYAHSPERIDLLNGIAGFFFGLIQDVLWEDTLLHLARLTDPLKSAGKPNLTLKRLPGLIPEPSLASDVQSLVEAAESSCSFARDWRNRHLAHRDLDLALETAATPLPESSREQVQNSLQAIGAVLNLINRRYFGSETLFEDFVAITDAESLVYYMEIARQTEARREERLLQGRPLPEDFESSV